MVLYVMRKRVGNIADKGLDMNVKELQEGHPLVSLGSAGSTSFDGPRPSRSRGRSMNIVAKVM
jgi:hypothetical protein